MSRGSGLCKRCGGPKKGRAARPSVPWTQCDECNEAICERHSVWNDGTWICTKCDNKRKAKPRQVIPEEKFINPYRTSFEMNEENDDDHLELSDQ